MFHYVTLAGLEREAVRLSSFASPYRIYTYTHTHTHAREL